MLLTIEQIKRQLKDKFSTPGGELDDLILIERAPLIRCRVNRKNLNLTLPKKYDQFCRKFNIDNFSLGPLVLEQEATI